MPTGSIRSRDPRADLTGPAGRGSLMHVTSTGETGMCASHLSRRELLRGALGAAGLAAVPASLRAALVSGGRRSAGADLEVALRAERWIRTTRVPAARGIVWPWDPARPDDITRSLYTGTPGVILFLLELHAATGDDALLDEARGGADDLIANLAGPGDFDGGLYTGVAGRAFTLGEAARITGDAKYRAAAARGIALLRENARPAGDGVAWSDSADIISGGAGILLFLLWAARHLDEDTVDLASAAGRRLIELGQPGEAGLKWALSPQVTNEYPNFSHGTAGIAYALATLHEATGNAAFLDAALEGAAYLDAVAVSGDGCRVFHHRPGGEELYYLSWCHGGPGTARLFERLHRITGDARWGHEVECHARGVTALGAPVERSPGYWNNISQCCGDAGVGEFFLALHRRHTDAGHLAVARRAADDILARATEVAGGLQWTQSEHRVQPDLLIAQTGRMQGAAGVGSFFLHLDAAQQGRPDAIVLPDSPW